MEICLKNPKDVKEQIKKASALLRVYQENLQGDQEEVRRVEKMVGEVEAVLKQRHTNLSVVMEYYRRQDKSAVAKESIAKIQAQINQCEEQQRMISKCREGILDMSHGIAILKEKMDTYVAKDKEVYLKTTQLIDRIMNAT